MEKHFEPHVLAGESTVEAAARATPVTLHPLSDMLLVLMDLQPASPLQPDQKRRKALPFPSGVVVEVGRGVYCPGVGYLESQLRVGDHVALNLTPGGNWRTVPLNPDPAVIYVLCSESLAVGKLEGATPESTWYKKYDDGTGTGLISLSP